MDKHNVEIGDGLGGLRGKIWRIGLMGDSAGERIPPNLGYKIAYATNLAADQRFLSDSGSSS